ncbi:MAG TPA: ABC transporter permease [Candidatus Acidoferrales bacterium]|nr:ABC transporter permease [Candidatus Acidoferrales bacterium]
MRPKRWLNKFSFWLHSLLHRRELDRELDDEIAYHIEAKTEANIANGMTQEEARRAAQIELGGVEQAKERVRAERVGAWFDTVLQDVRYSLRTLRKSPGFTAVAILTLALGIGANATIFSILDPLLLRKLPVGDPDSLVFLGNAGLWNSARNVDYDTAIMSELNAFRHYQDENRVFSALLFFTETEDYDLTRGEEASSASGETVSSNYFSMLGVRPYLGRLIALQDGDSATATPVAVLSYAYWQREFAADPAIIGQTISLANSGWSFDPLQHQLYEIIGVAPPGFSGIEIGIDPDFYLPAPNSGDSPAFVTIVARLKPGISLAQARASLAPIYQETVRESKLPALEREQDMSGLEIQPIPRGLSRVRDKFGLATQVAMALVGLVLLIACVNVANLLLARGISRRRELTVRMAIGAGRWRLIRQILIEAALLGSAGAIAGLLAANWTAKSLAAALSTKELPVQLDAALDVRVFVFAAAVLAITVLLCGLIPAMAATRGDLTSDLKVAGVNAAHAASRSRLGSLLLAAQISVSAIVLIATGLLLHSLFNLETYNLGFDADHILALTLTGKDASRALYDQLSDRAKYLPGVKGAAYSVMLPLQGNVVGINVTVPGYTPGSAAETHAYMNGVSPGYFQAMGIPLLAGRDFTPQDGAPQMPSAVIISRTMARHYFAGNDAVGQEIRIGGSGRPPLRVIGVVADSVYFGVREKTTDMIYTPYGRTTLHTSLMARATGNPAALASAVTDLIHSMDRSIKIESIETMRHALNDSLHEDRLIGALCGVFAALALALTCIGIYGVLSFQVARRTNEIGIRMALGAHRRDILSLILLRGLRILIAGLAIGIVGALAITRVIAHMLFGLSPSDFFTYAAVALVLLFAALAALYVPARRAMRIDPMVALRYE